MLQSKIIYHYFDYGPNIWLLLGENARACTHSSTYTHRGEGEDGRDKRGERMRKKEEGIRSREEKRDEWGRRVREGRKKEEKREICTAMCCHRILSVSIVHGSDSLVYCNGNQHGILLNNENWGNRESVDEKLRVLLREKYFVRYSKN